MTTANLNGHLRQAISALESGRFKDALHTCGGILSQQPNHSDALHVAALCSRHLGNIGDALSYFERCIKSNPRQPAVLGNYANALNQAGHYAQANSAYQSANALDKHNLDVLYNWANLLNLKLNRSHEALALIESAILLNPKQSRLFVCRGNIRRAQDQFEEADLDYNTALQLTPNHVDALLNKGIAYRAAGNPAAAIECYKLIIDVNPENSGLWFNLGCAYYDIGDNTQAENCLLKALDLSPNFVPAHNALNQLYWVSEHDDKFMQSYETARQRRAYDEHLFLAQALTLSNAKRDQDAIDILYEALRYFPDNANLLHSLGAMYSKTSKSANALELFEQALRKAPDNSRYRIDMANTLIVQGDCARALEHLDHAGQFAPLDQEIWAYKGTCWRLLGDDRAGWLNNYEQFVDARLLDVPEGYDNLQHFMHELRHALLSLHKTKREPLDQSVRGGTQTLGNLFLVRNPVIQDYQTTLKTRIRNYIDALPTDANHPFLNRKMQQIQFSGAWSVKLISQGFHTNHVHPQGWLSGNSYIEIPKEITPEDASQAGWFKLGQTSMQLAGREHLAASYCPAEGMSILFPSYMWHGTNPFSSDQPRLSAPFDVKPIT